MSLQTVKDKINTWVSDRWLTLVVRENAHFDEFGHYFQGLPTHAALVEQTDALTGDSTPDAALSSPTDQEWTWKGLIATIESMKLPARLRIDVYEAPEGRGWFATLEVLYKANVYSRTHSGAGPINHDIPWHKVEGEIIDL